MSEQKPETALAAIRERCDAKRREFERLTHSTDIRATHDRIIEARDEVFTADVDYIVALEAQNAALTDALAASEQRRQVAEGALAEQGTQMQERWDVYWTEVRRVLEVNNVDSSYVYDAFHNATILLQGVMRRQQAATAPADSESG